MTKQELLKKIEVALDDAIRQRLFGSIEIEFRAGDPVFLRTHRQEKLYNETETRHEKTYR
jgi:hypothetical protein